MYSPYHNIDFNCSYFDETQLIQKFKSCKNLKFLSWNLGSLPSKFEEFKEYVNHLQQNDIFLMYFVFKKYFL